MIWLKAFGWLLSAAVLLSSVAHLRIGLPDVQAQLRQHGVEPGSGLWIDATAGWSFGSVAMAAFGLIFAACVFRIRANRFEAWPVALIGLAYLVFGLGTCWSLGVRPHFVGFTVFGLLMLAWTFLARRTLVHDRASRI